MLTADPANHSYGSKFSREKAWVFLVELFDSPLSLLFRIIL
jgi:hypothetical protein